MLLYKFIVYKKNIFFLVFVFNFCSKVKLCCKFIFSNSSFKFYYFKFILTVTCINTEIKLKKIFWF